MTQAIDHDELEQFLAELSTLSRKYKIYIGGCGCCGSPWIARLDEDLQYHISNSEFIDDEYPNLNLRPLQ